MTTLAITALILTAWSVVIVLTIYCHKQETDKNGADLSRRITEAENVLNAKIRYERERIDRLEAGDRGSQ